MARVGLGRWLLSWVTKPLVAIKQPFESILRIVRGIVPGISQSTVAGAYRNAEQALGFQPTIDTMDRSSPWEISLMSEEKLGAPRRYLVTFEVQVSYPNEGITETEQRTVYFMDRLSASEYERQYLSQYMGEGERDTGILKGARAVNVSHNDGWHY
jgi:hypothetical protein